MAAIERGQKVLGAALDDLEATLGQPEVRNNFCVEQADRVGGDRIAEAWMKFLCDRGSADDLASLDDPDAQAGAGEIGRAGEAVMPRADDNDVGFVHGRFKKIAYLVDS